MESFMKADIFFFITSIVTVVLGILAVIFLYYLIKAVKNLSELSAALKEGFKDSEEFIIELKERLEDNMIFRVLFPAPRRRRARTAKDDSIGK